MELIKRHDIQHNNTQHNTTQHNNTQHNDIQHDDKWNETLSIMTVSIMALNRESCYAECHLRWVSQTSHYAECRMCWVSFLLSFTTVKSFTTQAPASTWFQSHPIICKCHLKKTICLPRSLPEMSFDQSNIFQLRIEFFVKGHLQVRFQSGKNAWLCIFDNQEPWVIKWSAW